MQLEREARAELRVLTERECRRLEAADAPRYSVMLDDGRRRWADVVIESGSRRRAIEIEFSPKGSSRLAQIVAAYACSDYDEVLFFVRNAALGARISGCASGARVRVLPWPELPAAERDRLARALAQGCERAAIGEGAAIG
jgi:urease beta subunit